MDFDPKRLELTEQEQQLARRVGAGLLLGIGGPIVGTALFFLIPPLLALTFTTGPFAMVGIAVALLAGLAWLAVNEKAHEFLFLGYWAWMAWFAKQYRKYTEQLPTEELAAILGGEPVAETVADEPEEESDPLTRVSEGLERLDTHRTSVTDRLREVDEALDGWRERRDNLEAEADAHDAAADEDPSVAKLERRRAQLDREQGARFARVIQQMEFFRGRLSDYGDDLLVRSEEWGHQLELARAELEAARLRDLESDGSVHEGAAVEEMLLRLAADVELRALNADAHLASAQQAIGSVSFLDATHSEKALTNWKPELPEEELAPTSAPYDRVTPTVRVPTAAPTATSSSGAEEEGSSSTRARLRALAARRSTHTKKP